MTSFFLFCLSGLSLLVAAGLWAYLGYKFGVDILDDIARRRRRGRFFG